MSLLNSVLSSINGGQPTPAPRPQSTPSVPRPKPPSRNPSQNTSEAPPKRKAEDAGGPPRPKVPKIETNTSRFESNASLVPPPSRSQTTSPAQKSALPPPKSQIPYRGTQQGPSKPPTTTKPQPASNNAAKPASTPAARPAITPTTPSGSGPAKGGYLAILERAKAASEAQKQAGQIKHKPVEKLTKKDRQRMLEEARKGNKPLSARDGKPQPKGRGKSAEPNDPKGGAPLKERRKPVEVAYKGTMRSAAPAPAYRGTMGGPGGAPRRPSAPSRPSYNDSRRYASYSDEEEEEEEEGNEYETESDMEAGMDEVYEEEEQAARIARREDAEALREENELKRQKAERKRKLDELSASAQKRRY